MSSVRLDVGYQRIPIREDMKRSRDAEMLAVKGETGCASIVGNIKHESKLLEHMLVRFYIFIDVVLGLLSYTIDKGTPMEISVGISGKHREVGGAREVIGNILCSGFANAGDAKSRNN